MRFGCKLIAIKTQTRPANEAANIKVNRLSAGVNSGSTIPVNVVRIAPPATINAPFKPAALPASLGRTDIAAALLPGMVNPLPRPTNIVLPKNSSGDTNPRTVTIIPIAHPKQATNLPTIIMVVGENLEASRAAI